MKRALGSATPYTCSCGAVKYYLPSQVANMKLPYRCGRCSARKKNPLGTAKRWGKK